MRGDEAGILRTSGAKALIVMTEGQTQGQADLAQQALDILTTCYPGHPWACSVQGTVLVIRHLEFDIRRWGMNLRLTEVDHDAAVFKRKVVLLAGEWLERAKLKRGRSEDAGATHVEGIPEAQQDWRVRYQRAFDDAEKARKEAPEGLREQPLPAAVEMVKEEQKEDGRKQIPVP